MIVLVTAIISSSTISVPLKSEPQLHDVVVKLALKAVFP